MNYNAVIEFIFSLGLFINAVSFIPQIIRIIKEKSEKGVSLITFSIFLASQLSAVLYGLVIKNNILVLGYALSILTCAPVVLLILFYRKNRRKLSALETNVDGVTFKDIIDQIPAHIYWKDFQGRYLGASNLQCISTGFKKNDFLGITDAQLLSSEQANKITVVDKQVLSDGLAIRCEEVVDLLGEKEKRYLSYKTPLRNNKGKTVALLGISVDITDARKQEVERVGLLENVIALMPGHVYWVDKEGVYQGCNDIQAKSAGLSSREEIVGKRNKDLPWNVNTFVPQVIDAVNEEIMISGQAKVLEEPVSYSNGENGYCLSSKTPLRDPAGKIIGLVGISIDITEKKKAEEELLKAKNAAEAANRAKTEFLANISHDVKTPLSGVIGMADLMMHDFSGRDYQRAEAIHACGIQLVAFFNGCLDLSKLEMEDWASTEEIFSLKSLLEEIRELFSPAAEVKKLQLTVECDPALPIALLGHRASIYRVILNLVGNALKFTEKGGIHVRGFLSEITTPGDMWIGLEVKDTGIGIPEDKFEIIFEKLRRLTPSYEGKVEGSGIGLYIVDQYVKRMEGKIQVQSVVGEGSSFTLLLPMKVVSKALLSQQEEADVAVEKPTPIMSSSASALYAESVAAVPEGAPYILLVEDNPLIQQVTQALLSSAGFLVDVAGTGAEAIEKFSPEKYGLIFMDIGLPDMDGYSVTQVMRSKEVDQHSQSTPIVALTAHGAIDVETFCGRAGMQGVISKPITREQAQAVWARYGLGKPGAVKGLTVIGHSETVPLTTEVIDMAGTIALLGSKEYAEELLTLWFEMLTHRFLPALEDLMKKRDLEGLRHELHAMLGSLCYVKTPLLHQAVLELQTASRSQPHELDTAYQHMLQEANRFMEQYQKARV